MLAPFSQILLLDKRSNLVKLDFVWSEFEINLVPVAPMLLYERYNRVKVEFDWRAVKINLAPFFSNVIF